MDFFLNNFLLMAVKMPVCMLKRDKGRLSAGCKKSVIGKKRESCLLRKLIHNFVFGRCQEGHLVTQNLRTNMSEFKRYATRHLGMNSGALESYMKITSSYISPTIIEERQLNVAQMDVFSRLMMDRIIFLGTNIDDYAANVIQAQLLYLDSSEPGKDISIYINSPGGSVYAGYGIYDTMQFIGCKVSTICTGIAASMASVLLVAGTKGKRYGLEHSRVMLHQPLGGAQGQASDIEIAAREILKVKKELYTIISKHSGKSYEEVERDSDRDYWMTSAEARDYGIIDEIFTRKTNDREA
jgi:ATP-dependent Clp protease protease subunit